MKDVTRILGEIEAGDPSAADKLEFTIATFQVMAMHKSKAPDRLVFTDAVYEFLDRKMPDVVPQTGAYRQ